MSTDVKALKARIAFLEARIAFLEAELAECDPWLKNFRQEVDEMLRRHQQSFRKGRQEIQQVLEEAGENSPAAQSLAELGRYYARQEQVIQRALS